MINVLDYTVTELIYSSVRSAVYRGQANQDKRPVVIKVLNIDYPTRENLAKLRREYDIARDLNFEGILHPIDIIPFQQGYALILEDFGGISLGSVMTKHKIGLLACMQIAVKLVDTIGRIHQKGIIHKDIKPSNIIINEETGQVKLTDFSIASHIFGERQEHVNPDILEGTLSYISPEQTGRMNRSIDHRADLYSLGVTLYEMLTGVLPFSATGAMELIHCHMAVPPKPPREIEKDIPAPLSDIVMKLLAKNAEDRYRSAFGLKHDLEECLAKFSTSGTVERFVLGTRDIPATLQIPEKLYGREGELAELMSAFSRVAQGRTEMMMVKGSTGIGKSVLINELYKPVIVLKGYFAAGKFDQFKRNVPYSALRQAFQELIRQLLSERTERIIEWQEKIQAALGPNGQIIADLIPEIELIIGKQPPVEPLPPAQSQNRFNLVFTEFVKVFASQEHPLVLFLDDIQWVDWGTLKLVELLATARDMNSLLLIGAYRDTEVGLAHPLMLTLDVIIKTGVTTREILLKPLPVNGVVELITDTLACSHSAAESLAEVVMNKTQGNPFFINQFLRNLYQKQMIRFDVEKYSWEWDVAAIQSADITSNVVEFMCNKIKQLSPAARNSLTMAACIGNKFDLDLLAQMRDKTAADTAITLHEPQLEGMIAPIGDSYKYVGGYTGEDTTGRMSPETGIPYVFIHDRIQQAAYSLIPEEQKKKLHYKVGRIMIEQTPVGEREEKLFEIVQHLNISADQITSVSELTELTGFNLEVTRKAKAANAYDTALQFASNGIVLLRNNGWQDNYELTRDLSFEKAECEYLVGNFEKAEPF
jgi:serine/threonine protein kinase